MDDIDSLRLELEAITHARRTDNEYLVGVLDQIRDATRKPNGVITNEWYWDAWAAVDAIVEDFFRDPPAVLPVRKEDEGEA